MIAYSLPVTVTVDGKEYAIRSDFRAVLDIITALNDPELSDTDKAVIALRIFYKDEIPRNTDAAIKECFSFIDGGGASDSHKPAPKLVDWEQDFRWIIAPINRIAGRDVRAEPLHWWTFLSFYYEIGDCMFAQIVHIRDMRARGKRLDKQDREWAARNEDIIRIKQKTTEAEDDLLALWGGMNHAD